jgi:hypothetical protein
MYSRLYQIRIKIVRSIAGRLRLVSIVDDEPDITDLFKDALTDIANIRIFTFTDPVGTRTLYT